MTIVRAILIAGFVGSLAFAPETRGEGTDSGSDVLRALAEAEGDFRGCDRDWSRVNDFWTTDVAGLYTVTSTGVLLPGTEGALRVIEFSLESAGSDSAPTRQEAP